MNDSTEEPTPWPVAGEKLFTPTKDWQFNACLNFTSSPKWDAYASGYKEAADNLVTRVIETRYGMDMQIFPIAFLYRQYLELRLKEIIIEGSRLEDLPSDFRNTHNLLLLWERARKLLERIYANDSTDVLDIVEERIKEFASLDASSYSFRYPVDTVGNPTLAGVKYINIKQLTKVMNGVAALLDGSSMGISAYHDYKSDAESYYY